MKASLSVVLAFLLLAGSVPVAFAQDSPAKAIAVVLSVRGTSEMRKQGQATWAPAAFGLVIDDGDELRTGTDGFISLVFTDDKSQLKIRPSSTIVLRGERDEDYSIAKRVNMEVGELFADVKQQKGSLQVVTPTSVASVKGTSFWVLVDMDGLTRVLALEGIVGLQNVISGLTQDVAGGSSGTSTPEGDVSLGSLEDVNVPEFIEELEQSKEIRVRFTDEDGNEKLLIINYSEEGE